MAYRGSTPTVVFRLPEEITIADLSEVRLTFSQNGSVVKVGANNLVKLMSNDDFAIDDHTFSCTLSQEETLAFNKDFDLALQVRYLLEDGTTAPSRECHFKVDDILDKDINGGVIE